MFLRWRHRKWITPAQRKYSVPGYVFKKTHPTLAGQPFYRNIPERTHEQVLVALVESARVDGKPRTRVLCSLISYDPRQLPQPWWWKTRQMVARLRALDIPVALKKRFLEEVEARGVTFTWPKSLDPITPEEQAEQDAALKIEGDELSEKIRVLMGKVEGP